MNNKLYIKKGLECGNTIEILHENTKIRCCNTEMEYVKLNLVDASFKKHIPNY